MQNVIVAIFSCLRGTTAKVVSEAQKINMSQSRLASPVDRTGRLNSENWLVPLTAFITVSNKT